MHNFSNGCPGQNVAWPVGFVLSAGSSDGGLNPWATACPIIMDCHSETELRVLFNQHLDHLELEASQAGYRLCLRLAFAKGAQHAIC